MSGNGCGCHQGNETHNQCGTFDTPSNPDAGAAFPYRVKENCEAPNLPEPACDEEFTTEYDPDNVDSPFTIIASLYDSLCNLILDENSESIVTPLQ